MKDRTLEAHIKNDTIAQSYLLIDRDIIKLKKIAKWFSERYNTADIFQLENTAFTETPTQSLEIQTTSKVPQKTQTPKTSRHPQAPIRSTTSTQAPQTKNILVKETEEFISLAHLASIGDKKLLIICDAATMTTAAQNKILKTIEETPTNTTFMLLASSETPILNTIKSRCIKIYPDPVNPSLTEAAIYEQNPNTNSIFTTVETILTNCKTLDEALPHLPLLTKRENLPITLSAFNTRSSKLTIQKRNAILKRLAIINRNIAAGCNAQNIFDSLLIEHFK